MLLIEKKDAWALGTRFERDYVSVEKEGINYKFVLLDEQQQENILISTITESQNNLKSIIIQDIQDEIAPTIISSSTQKNSRISSQISSSLTLMQTSLQSQSNKFIQQSLSHIGASHDIQKLSNNLSQMIRNSSYSTLQRNSHNESDLLRSHNFINN
ncbi:hypothetical protein Glove_84g42 [Diversispora epigaea]|uniref:Uncharacterized protein n=1 Tax=Diversispora epigaea TaxID=1348612 RepID=A0A397J793_9GLOM|nr:hypothetical protein Glove_84g42 [Diversispora epigaea]